MFLFNYNKTEAYSSNSCTIAYICDVSTDLVHSVLIFSPVATGDSTVGLMDDSMLSSADASFSVAQPSEPECGYIEIR